MRGRASDRTGDAYYLPPGSPRAASLALPAVFRQPLVEFMSDYNVLRQQARVCS
ncbi:hypothetical protein [Paracoccus spongiarum]|uniref:Uncharacterized protein n=1 Tax=Paracoccus spongiarum TaxID=3064387 RepID=A0ABT9JHE7_9RHOB|nr:hypothetical protein [Paracoccus sp. 2205BS29-5]MDP5309263.1 hypothetical protein [Paracoccus sp. 2205BS29-5]